MSGIRSALPGRGGDATPWLALPEGAVAGIPSADLGELQIGPATFRWGLRTYLMGIVNVTPDSFSGDGLLGRGRVVEAAVEQGRRMVTEGADLLDIGGESSRPGHEPVPADEEQRRILPVIEALHGALPDVPLSVDTTKAEVAAAALSAGAHMVNDVWGVSAESELLALVAERRVPLVLMHNRDEARYDNVVAEVIAELEAALERAQAAGVAREAMIIDPGIGFGKTPEQNLAILHDFTLLHLLRRPILLGTSRKSTIGLILDLPAEERLEGTMATTALAVAAGVDIVRVHDVRANLRAARMADAIARGTMGPR